MDYKDRSFHFANKQCDGAQCRDGPSPCGSAPPSTRRLWEDKINLPFWGLALLPLALKSTLDSIEGVPFFSLLTAMPNQIGNAMLPTRDTHVTVSQFWCYIVFPDLMIDTIILLTVMAPIAACCISRSHCEWFVVVGIFI